jgi:hypothetical protein
MSFARDSESPGSAASFASIDTEDIPIEQLILHTQLTQDLADLIAAGTVWSFDELDLAPIRPQDRLKPVQEWGQNAEDWVTCMRKMKSSGKYIKELNAFLVWFEAQPKCTEADLLSGLKKYIQINFDEDQTAQADRKASTTMRSTFSILTKWWKYSGRGDLKMQAPIIGDELTEWDKEHVIKKAPVFTMGNMGKRVSFFTIYRHI